MSIPGTGLSNRIRLDSQDAADNPGVGGQRGVAPPQMVPDYAVSAGEEIRSASTELMNSPAMDGLRDVLRKTRTERIAIDAEVRSAESEFNVAVRRFDAWDRGFLFKKIFKSRFDSRKSEFELSSAKLQELREQLRLTAVSTEINIEGPVAEAYFKMRDAFSALSECHSTWDKLSRAPINRAVTRSAASEGVILSRLALI